MAVCRHKAKLSAREKANQEREKKRRKRERGGNFRVTENYSREPQSRTISYAPSKVTNGVPNIPYEY